jgi:hypothetical protein
LTKLLPRWQSRIGGNAPHIGADILICSTFVVQIFDDALAKDSPFHGFRAPSRFPVLLPADVVAAPSLVPIPS